MPGATPRIIEARLNDMFAAQEVAEAIPPARPRLHGEAGWSQGALFSALGSKMAIQCTIGSRDGCGLKRRVGVLLSGKERDIAILKTWAAPGQHRRIHLQGWSRPSRTTRRRDGDTDDLHPRSLQLINVPIDVYQISYVPFTLHMTDFVVVILSAIFICFVATIYPSRQAAKLDPAQALRYG